MADVSGGTELASGKEYDPETETDPLIRRYITRNARGDAVLREYHYPVWSLILNWRQLDRKWERVHEWFYDVPLETLRVAERFAERYPDEIEEYFLEREAYSR
jgi:hypothetical protein